MAGKTKTRTSSKDAAAYHARNMRRNQIIFAVFAVILILSMMLSAAVYLK